jgi:uncharacterized phiE125 gp8 family phage protein
VRTFDAAGNPVVLEAGLFDLQGSKLTLAAGASPAGLSGVIEVDLTAGFGTQAGDVPEGLRQAMRLLVAHFYAHRADALHEEHVTHFPAAIAAFVAPWRGMRLV